MAEVFPFPYKDQEGAVADLLLTYRLVAQAEMLIRLLKQLAKRFNEHLEQGRGQADSGEESDAPYSIDKT